MASSVEKLRYHLVWVTKYRYNLLDTEEIVSHLHGFFDRAQSRLSFGIISESIQSNHVHLLIECDSQIDLNELIRKLKGGSSYSLRKRFRHLMVYENLWSPSHYIGSVGDVSSQIVKDYVESQGNSEEETITRTFVYDILPSATKFTNLAKYLTGKNSQDKTLAPASIIQNANRVSSDSIALRNDLIKLVVNDNKMSQIWLRIPGGVSCQTKQFYVGLIGRKLPESFNLADSYVKITESDNGQKTFRVFLSIQEKIEVSRPNANRVISIDLGVKRPITSVALENGEIHQAQFYGKRISSENYKRNQRFAKLQKNGVEEPKKYLKGYGNRINNEIHQITSSIVKDALIGNYSIVIGNIRNINEKWRKRRSSKELRKRGNRVPYGKIMSRLAYKAKLYGIPCVFVNEAYSSQRCKSCGNIDKNSRINANDYVCTSCKATTQADVNGAYNIGTINLRSMLDAKADPLGGMTPPFELRESVRRVGNSLLAAPAIPDEDVLVS